MNRKDLTLGLTYTSVVIRGVNGDEGEFRAEFLVDSGASDSVAPRSQLAGIGVKPTGTRRYELADGSTHEFEIGYVWLETMGESTVARVIFGADDVEPILGVIALESMGLTLDPVNQTLKKIPALYLK